MKNDRRQRTEIIRVGKLLHQRAYVAATDGNISVRLDRDRVLVTPTGMCKGMMAAGDLVTVDMRGRKLGGRRSVSSEVGMHLQIYSLRPDVKAVVHAHPPTATGYAAAGMALNQALVSEIVLALGCVPLAKYATPGTRELSAELAPLIPEYDAILMANHGVVTYGEDLLRAYMNMETVEHFARIALVTHLLGREQPLGEEEVRGLMVAREKYESENSGSAAPRSPVVRGRRAFPQR